MTIFIWSALAPGVIVLVAALIASRYAPRLAWLIPTGLALGYGAGHIGLVGWQGFGGDITHVLLVLAVLGAVAGIVGASLGARVRWVLRVVLSLAAAWLVLRPLLPATTGGAGLPSNAIAGMWWPALAAAMTLVWAAVDRLAERDAGRVLPSLLVILALAGGATVLFAGNATTATLAGALAATLGALFLAGLLRPRDALLRLAGAPIALLLVGQWSIGHFYTDEMSLFSGALLVAAPILAAVLLPLFEGRRRSLAIAIQLVALAVPAGLAAGLGAMSYFAPPASTQSATSAPSSSSKPTAAPQPQSDDDYGY